MKMMDVLTMKKINNKLKQYHNLILYKELISQQYVKARHLLLDKYHLLKQQQKQLLVMQKNHKLNSSEWQNTIIRSNYQKLNDYILNHIDRIQLELSQIDKEISQVKDHLILIDAEKKRLDSFYSNILLQREKRSLSFLEAELHDLICARNIC